MVFPGSRWLSQSQPSCQLRRTTKLRRWIGGKNRWQAACHSWPLGILLHIGDNPVYTRNKDPYKPIRIQWNVINKGFAPSCRNLVFIYRSLLKKTTNTYNLWKSTVPGPPKGKAIVPRLHRFFRHGSCQTVDSTNRFILNSSLPISLLARYHNPEDPWISMVYLPTFTIKVNYSRR